MVALGLSGGQIERGVKVARIDLVKEVAGLNIGAVGGELGLNVARRPRLQCDAADRFDPAWIVEIDWQRLLDDRNDRDRHRHHCRRRRRFRGPVRVVARDAEAYESNNADCRESR